MPHTFYISRSYGYDDLIPAEASPILCSNHHPVFQPCSKPNDYPDRHHRGAARICCTMYVHTSCFSRSR